MQVMTSEVNQMKRQSLPIFVTAIANAESTFQVTNCKGTFEIGSLLQIHLRTITSPGRLIMLEVLHGSPREARSGSGYLRDRFFGSMGNVRLCDSDLLFATDRCDH